MSKVKAMMVALTLVFGALATTAVADQYSSRQYYSNWSHNTQRGYHYRTYYYKPTPNYVGYRHHYVVYSPSRPRHYYFYNPYKKQYWGRCDVNTNGKGQYSLLAEADRKGTLDEIPESAFPAPGPMPRIPDSNPGENAGMDLPPDDLPQGDTLPKVTTGRPDTGKPDTSKPN